MMIIGCDFHTRYQQIAMLDDATGELTERRLDHPSTPPRHMPCAFTGAGSFVFRRVRIVSHDAI